MSKLKLPEVIDHGLNLFRKVYKKQGNNQNARMFVKQVEDSPIWNLVIFVYRFCPYRFQKIELVLELLLQLCF